MLPLCADFTQPLALPVPRRPAARTVVFFPGSTIGNFAPDEALALLRRTARRGGPDGGLLLGADLRKDPAIIEAAYNDRRGITDMFNLNLLARINRELEGDFVLERFAHRAFFDADQGRVEMHLVSRCDQRVHVGGDAFMFTAGESIHTENSYKYSLDELRELAEAAAFTAARMWTDDARYFSVQYLRVR